MKNKFFILVVVVFIVSFPTKSLALQAPKDSTELAILYGVTSTSYQVVDMSTGEVLISKDPSLPWVPASLTKLVTALVVLDTKPKLTKVFAITKEDQVVGGCSQGGACIKSVNGVKFTVDGLFHASVIASANNATSALARSTGLSTQEFVKRMNAKAKALGAKSTSFTEVTGMDPANKTTAEDYAKIIQAAYKNTYLKSLAQKKSYSLKSTNNSKYNQTLKTTDALLSNPDYKMLIGKTGYLEESKYNFAAIIKYHGKDDLAVVVLGANTKATAFSDTGLLAKLAEDAKALSSGKISWLSQ